MPAIHPAATVASIGFDRRKYGPPLLADACTVASMPFFITTPRPHRLGFYEIALITEGRGALALDGVAAEVAPYRICITAPGEVRSWQLAGARLGALLAFFETDLFDDAGDDPGRPFIETLPVALAAPAQRSIAVERRRFHAIAALVESMADELRAPDADTPRMLRAQACQLMIAVQRASGVTASVPPENRAAVLSRRFAELVAERVGHGDSVSRHAERLGVTVRHLNHCVRERTGLTAGETIRRRLFLEARRRLLAGALPVAAVAESLGFSDTPYFIRFFKRHAGVTPGEFRAARGSATSDRPSPLPDRDG
jgi:AraC-like DNA-binding protein